jgi:hypothetical protein
VYDGLHNTRRGIGEAVRVRCGRICFEHDGFSDIAIERRAAGCDCGGDDFTDVALNGRGQTGGGCARRIRPSGATGARGPTVEAGARGVRAARHLIGPCASRHT